MYTPFSWLTGVNPRHILRSTLVVLSFFIVTGAVLYAYQQVFAFSGSGSGTAEDPYIIMTCEQLAEVDNDLAAHYRLGDYIGCGAENFPLARVMDGSDLDAGFGGFTGVFDGDGYTISYQKNVPAEIDDQNYLGLFGYLNGATIRDLHIVAGWEQGPGGTDVLYGGSFVGSLAGKAVNTLIINVSASNNIQSANTTGGLVGQMNNSRIVGGSFEGSIDATSQSGGLVGEVSGNYEGDLPAIEQSYTFGSFTAGWGVGNVGGLVGYMTTAEILNSYSQMDVNAYNNVGGLVGNAIGSSIVNAYASGSVTGNNTVGGLVGRVFSSGSSIENAFAAGIITGSSYIGGVVGGVGDFGGDNPSFLSTTNTYWDATMTGMSECSGLAEETWAGCTMITPGDPTTYWKLGGVEPMLTWNTTDIWNLDSMSNYPWLFAYTEPTFASGTGVEGDPYVITNCTQLQLMNTVLDAHFVLGSDIDCLETEGWNENTAEWVDGVVDGELIPDSYNDIPGVYGAVSNNGYYGFEPIGSDGDPFTGVFDGDGYTINDLWIFRKEQDNVGLFGYTAGATIEDFDLVAADIVGESNVGGVVGTMEDTSISDVTIFDSHVRAYLSYYGGGIAGIMMENTGTSTISYVTMSGGGVHGSGNIIGGLIGKMYDGILTYANSSASVDGGFSIGGAIGEMSTGSVSYVDITGSVHSDRTEGEFIAKSGENTGGFVGYMYEGTITSSTASGDVECEGGKCGGFIGYAASGNALITNSSASGDVTVVDGFSPSYIGGFAGYVENSGYNWEDPYVYGVEWVNLSAAGSVFATSSDSVGGFAGRVYGYDLSSVSSTGGVVIGDSYVGGFVGEIFNSSVSSSTASSTVTGMDNYIGGFAGYSGCQSRFTRSQAFGDVFGAAAVGGFSGADGCEGYGSTFTEVYTTGDVVASVVAAGGLIGEAYLTTVERSYALGNVTATGDNVGGLIGQMIGYDGYEHSSVTDSYARGNVESTSGVQVGGLVGYIGAYTDMVNVYATGVASGTTAVGGLYGGGDVSTAAFWDIETSGLSAGCGYGCDDTAVGTSTERMKTQSMYTDAGWDFETVWTFEGANIVNDGYPILQFQTVGEDTETLTPELLSPEDGSSHDVDAEMDITFVLPETPLSNSITIAFLPEVGDPIVLQLRDAAPEVENTFTIIPNQNLSLVEEVLSASTSTIPTGTYTILLAYQDVFGNPVATDSVSEVLLYEFPELVMGETTGIGQTQATLNASVVDGSVELFSEYALYGFIVSENSDPTVENAVAIPGPVVIEELGSYEWIFGDDDGEVLECGTTYYVRALGVLMYGETLLTSENVDSFTTLDCDEEEGEEEPRPRSGGGSSVSISRPRPTDNTTATTGALVINNGDETTTSRTVSLKINATNAVEMAISNSPLFSDSTYIPFTSSAKHTLSAGEGQKTVYVKLRSATGGTLLVLDSIQLSNVVNKKPSDIVPLVLTTPIPQNGLQCTTNLVLTTPVKLGAPNNPNDVKLLEQFLNTYEGTNLPVNGIYETADFNAVVKWQEKYASDILTPWGLTKGSGYVYTTSLKKIKEIHEKNCATAGTTPVQPTTPVSASCLNTQTTLTQGMTGALVTTAQTLLQKLNYFTVTPTGFFGPVTTASVKAFQSANGIDPVGYIGPATRAKLNELGCR